MEAVASSRSFFLLTPKKQQSVDRWDEVEAYGRVQIAHAEAGHGGGTTVRGMVTFAIVRPSLVVFEPQNGLPLVFFAHRFIFIPIRP